MDKRREKIADWFCKDCYSRSSSKDICMMSYELGKCPDYFSDADEILALIDKLPTLGEQTCKICGVADGLNFTVPDEDWQSIVNPELREKVLCLKCFDKMAVNAMRSYLITEMYFAGIKQGFRFVPDKPPAPVLSDEEIYEIYFGHKENFNGEAKDWARTADQWIWDLLQAERDSGHKYYTGGES